MEERGRGDECHRRGDDRGGSDGYGNDGLRRVDVVGKGRKKIESREGQHNQNERGR